MIQRNEQSRIVKQSGPKHHKKSSDLRRSLKAVSDIDEVTLDGRLFRVRKAATGNVRSPMVQWNVAKLLPANTVRLNCHHLRHSLKAAELCFVMNVTVFVICTLLLSSLTVGIVL